MFLKQKVFFLSINANHKDCASFWRKWRHQHKTLHPPLLWLLSIVFYAWNACAGKKKKPSRSSISNIDKFGNIERIDCKRSNNCDCFHSVAAIQHMNNRTTPAKSGKDYERQLNLWEVLLLPSKVKRKKSVGIHVELKMSSHSYFVEIAISHKYYLTSNTTPFPLSHGRVFRVTTRAWQRNCWKSSLKRSHALFI